MWTEYVEAVCMIISTIATVLGIVFVVVQIKNGTKAQQDKKAPLLVLERKNNSMAAISVKNVGELSAKIVKITVKLTYRDGKSEEKNASDEAIIIERDAEKALFSLSNEISVNTDLVTKVIADIKYESPLNDRMRTCHAEYIRS